MTRPEQIASGDGRAPREDGEARRARTRLRVGAAVALALAAAAAAVLLLQPRTPAHSNTGTGVPPGETTTEVQRRTLVERSQVDGTLGYGAAREIYDRLAGTFTWLPAVGAVIRRGGALFRVDDKPVVLMYGSVPSYRTLKEGVSAGPDVAELNANLVALGFDPYGAIAAGERFTAATAAAVRRWQRAEGLAQTGEIELGRIVFAPGARRVTTVHVAVGQDPPGSSSQEPAGSSEPAASSESSKGGSASKDGSGSEESARSPEEERRRSRAKEGERARASEKERSPSGKEGSPSGKEGSPSGKEGSPSGKEGSPSGEEGSGGAPELVLGTSSIKQVVQLQVKADQQELAHVGEVAPVTLPDGRTVHGRITHVGTVASESSENEKAAGSGSGENATVAVTLVLAHPVARLDKAPVSVQLVKSIRRNVLAVPATALVATAGGNYAVQALEGGRRVELPVTPGMFADGYVQVEGSGIRAGLTVLEPQ